MTEIVPKCWCGVAMTFKGDGVYYSEVCGHDMAAYQGYGGFFVFWTREELKAEQRRINALHLAKKLRETAEALEAYPLLCECTFNIGFHFEDKENGQRECTGEDISMTCFVPFDKGEIS